MSQAAAIPLKQPTVLGAAWDRFWFSPADPLPLCVLRVIVGATALYYALSFTADLDRWFGPAGILQPEATARLIQSGRLVTSPAAQRPTFHPSFFDFATGPTSLTALHWGMILVIVLFTAGVFTRVTSVLALISVLSYYHRAPMLAGQLDAPLAIMLFYVCLGPAGACLSVDAWLRKRAAKDANANAAPSTSVAANIAVRLIQLHLTALYFVIAVTQLGSSAWWSGLGVWWLAARPEARLVDLTHLYRWEYLFNLWNYAVVAIEFAFVFFVWRSWARTQVLIAALLMWLSLIPVTGLTAWCLFMALMGAAFVPADTLRRFSQPNKAE